MSCCYLSIKTANLIKIFLCYLDVISSALILLSCNIAQIIHYSRNYFNLIRFFDLSTNFENTYCNIVLHSRYNQIHFTASFCIWTFFESKCFILNIVSMTLNILKCFKWFIQDNQKKTLLRLFKWFYFSLLYLRLISSLIWCYLH